MNVSRKQKLPRAAPLAVSDHEAARAASEPVLGASRPRASVDVRTQALRQQLQTIARLQQRLLPQAIPQPAGWSISVAHSAGDWPGGDYYDFLPLPNGQLLFFLGDASGHGGPAAVMMALTRMTLHSCPLSSGADRLPFCPLHKVAVQPPGVLLGHLNRVLIENTLEEQFMTALCGTLDLAGGALRFANAGHPPPRWWRAATRQVGPLPDIGGLPLGIDPQTLYPEASIGIGPGDVIVACTDGLTEAWPLSPRARSRRDSGARRRPARIRAAMNRRGEVFGHERLDAALASAAARGAAAVKEAVVEALTSFLDGGQCHDDTTLVVIQRSPERCGEPLNDGR